MDEDDDIGQSGDVGGSGSGENKSGDNGTSPSKNNQ